MKIAFVHPRYPSSEGTGATHSATQIVDGLASSGYDVSVYCTRSPTERSHSDLYDIYELAGNSRHPHTDTRLNKEVKARQEELQEYDIVHSYLMRLIPSMAAVGRDSSVRTIVTLNAYGGICAKNDLRYRDQEHCKRKSAAKCIDCIMRSGDDNSDHGYMYTTLSRMLSLRLIESGEDRLKYIDGYQALSPHVKETYSAFGYDTDKINVIPNILDSLFDIEHRSDFKEPFRILYVGGLRKSKGVDRLINIFSQVLEQSNKAVTLTIVGDGGLKKKLQQQVERAKLSSIIDIRGQVSYNKLPKIYAEHDIFLYPGRWNEPFGRVFLEAMAAGTPIVATDVGSVREIIGKGGIITDQNTPSLVEGVISMLDTHRLREHSLAGKEKVDEYRLSNVLSRFEALYTSVQ